jgi:hypothetical protein
MPVKLEGMLEVALHLIPLANDAVPGYPAVKNGCVHLLPEFESTLTEPPPVKLNITPPEPSPKAPLGRKQEFESTVKLPAT